MKRLLSHLVIALITFSFSLNADGAESIRMRFVVSIYTDERGASLRHPESVFMEGKNLLVADSQNSRLLRYTYEDRSIKGGTEIKVAQLTYPLHVKLNSKGEIYALDGRLNRIVMLSPVGEFKAYLTPVGIPSPESFAVVSFTTDSEDHIYILDTLSRRVIQLNSEGSYQRHVTFPLESGSFTDVAVDSRGTIFIIDSGNARVYSAAKDAPVFTPVGERLNKYVRCPTAIAVDRQGIIYLVDHNGASVLMISQNGSVIGQQLSMGWNDGLLYYPSQLCINDKGDVVIADRGNNRIQIFTVTK